MPTAANGSQLGCIGELVTKVQVGQVVKENVRVLAIENLNTSAILGIDCLAKFGTFGINWTNNVLNLGDKHVILEKRKYGSVLRPAVVSLISDQTIPPRSQCFVTGQATQPYFHQQNDAIFTPYVDKMAKLDILVGAGVVLSSKAHAVPVTVMNNGEYPVYLYAGTRIGELTPIKVEDRTTVHQTCSKQSENHLPEKAGPVHVDFDQCDVVPLQRDELKKLLNEYRDIFASNEKEVGRTNRAQFKINTKNNVPIAVKLRRTPFALRSEVDRQINDMKERRVIEPSNSPYSSTILLVPKPDG